ncbi:MAG TPA: MBL fold metallo-hydrolase [Solirubrobacteraceae bacterium]|jgi:glyoxylase-like metal-dependent hydrolase (beta-lactamase superfamily II)
MRTQVSAVAERVYRLGTRWENFHLVGDADGWTLIDAGYPGYLGQLTETLAALGSSADAVAAVVVTHHHVDHMGCAAALQQRRGTPVFVGVADAPIVAGERRSHVPPGFYRQSWRPSMMAYLAHTVRVGGAQYRPVPEVREIKGEQVLDAPGRPRIVPTPGHTAGHLSAILDSCGVLFAGDALVNFDYASGRRGIALHRFNEDRERARSSLQVPRDLEADVVVFGHGDPWNGSPREAVDQALGG